MIFQERDLSSVRIVTKDSHSMEHCKLMKEYTPGKNHLDVKVVKNRLLRHHI